MHNIRNHTCICSICRKRILYIDSYLVLFGGAGAVFPFRLVGLLNWTKLPLFGAVTGALLNVLSLVTGTSRTYGKKSCRILYSKKVIQNKYFFFNAKLDFMFAKI